MLSPCFTTHRSLLIQRDALCSSHSLHCLILSNTILTASVDFFFFFSIGKSLMSSVWSDWFWNQHFRWQNMLEPRIAATSLFLGMVLAWSAAPLAESAVGVNWGTVSFRKLSPSTVVGLMKDNKIPKVKLFEAEPDVLNALRGSGIEVMVGIPNEMLSLLSTSPSAADMWVRQNVSAYMGKGGADIRLVSTMYSCLLSSFKIRNSYIL